MGHFARMGPGGGHDFDVEVEVEEKEQAGEETAGWPGKWTRTGRALQRRASGEAAPGAGEAEAVAAEGMSSPGELPFRGRIQGSFGRYEVGGVRVHTGIRAETAAAALGAHAYTVGEDIVLGEQPELFTVAHEVAHVLQQRAGFAPSDGVGEEGDAYERHADAVAERVVRGESAEDLLAGALGRAAAPVKPVQGRALQRKGIVNVGYELYSDHAKVSLEAGFKGESASSYIKTKFEGYLVGEGEVSWKAPPVNIGGKGKVGNDGKDFGIEIRARLIEQAKAQGGDVAEKAYIDDFSVDTVDLEFESPKGTSKKGGGNSDQPPTSKPGGETQVSMGVRLIIKTKGGHEARPFLNLVSYSQKGGESSFDFLQFGTELRLVLPNLFSGSSPASFKFSLPHDAKVKGKGYLKPIITWSPNWSAIMKEAVERYGPQILRNILAATGTEVLAAGVFLAGGALTIAAAALSFGDIDDINETADRALKACDGYYSGYVSGLGVKQGLIGDPVWQGYGTQGGEQGLHESVMRVLQNPALAAYGFTPAEVSDAFKEVLNAHADDVRKNVLATFPPAIKARYVRDWRAMKSKQLWGWYPEAYIDRDEKYLRTRMGLPDRGALPAEGDLPLPGAPPEPREPPPPATDTRPDGGSEGGSSRDPAAGSGGSSGRDPGPASGAGGGGGTGGAGSGGTGGTGASGDDGTSGSTG